MALLDLGNEMVWHALKLYLPPNTRLTSVYRPPEAQLDFIVRTAKRHGFNFSSTPRVQDPGSWRSALTFVRSKGYKVAAPGVSKHQQGMAYDLAGPDLKKIEAGVRKAVAEGRIRLVKDSKAPILVETKNKCVHVEIESAVLDYEPFEVV